MTDEIMMPHTTPEALSLAEIHAMRQVADSIRHMGEQTVAHMAASTRAMEKLGEKVDGMNTRLIRLEEAKHGREIERLQKSLDNFIGRLDALESDRDKRNGALGLAGWLHKLWPAGAALLAGWIGIKTGSV